MYLAEELLSPSVLAIPGKMDVGARELEVAAELVNRMSAAWDPRQHRAFSPRHPRRGY